MSTKKLSRTAMEGGRAKASQCDYRLGTRRERNHNLTRLRSSDGAFRDDDPVPMNTKRSKDYGPLFADKLNPVLRYLDSRVGKSWDKTYAILREKYGSMRKIKDFHLIDHIVRVRSFGGGYVDTTPKNRKQSDYNYYVDGQGILRKSPPYRRWRSIRPKVDEAKLEELLKWCGDRRVGKISGKLHWFEPIYSRSARSDVIVRGLGPNGEPYGPRPKKPCKTQWEISAWEPGKRLNQEEHNFFMLANEPTREKISPTATP